MLTDKGCVHGFDTDDFYRATVLCQQLCWVKMPLLMPSPLLDLPLPGVCDVTWNWSHLSQLCLRLLICRMGIILLWWLKEKNVAQVVCKYETRLKDVAHSSRETKFLSSTCTISAPANGSISDDASWLSWRREPPHLPSQSWWQTEHWRSICLTEPRACYFLLFFFLSFFF